MTRNAKVQIAGKLSYRDQLEAYFRANPTASATAAAAATQAPRAAAYVVRERMVAAGVIKARRAAGLWASL